MSTTKTSYRGGKVFRALLPKTYKAKSQGYYKFGHDDRLALDIIKAINNSSTAKKASRKYADFIQGDGFVDVNLSRLFANKKKGITFDKLLQVASISMSYFGAVPFLIGRTPEGDIGSVEVVPFQKYRKGIEGDWYYNETIGEEKENKSAWVKVQDFQGVKITPQDVMYNIEHYGGRGEIYYMHAGNPFDSDIYAIPDFLAGYYDLKTHSELINMDYEAVLNGFVFGGIMTFIGVDDTIKKESTGMTEREEIEDSMASFTGLNKDKDELTTRFAIMAHFANSKDEAPIYSPHDPKAILESSIRKREEVERSISRMWDVHPVLLGHSEASVLGNDKAFQQAEKMLAKSVRPTQRMIEQTLKMFYPNFDFTIASYSSDYIEPSLMKDLTEDERRALIGYEPKEQAVTSEGERILKVLNGLSPLLATKLVDLIPEDKLLNILGIKAENTPQNEQ